MKEIKPKKKIKLEVGDEVEIVQYKTGNYGNIKNVTSQVGSEFEILLVEIKSIRTASFVLEMKK